MFVLYLLPLTLLLWFVASFSVNVPYMDQWILVYLYQKVATSSASFSDFFALNNEHRILFPKLIFVALAFASKWNIRYEICLNIALAILTFLPIYKLSTNQLISKTSRLFQLSTFLSCMLVFSLAQYENWLWGFQVAFFLVQACVANAIFILNSKSLSICNRFLLAAIFCFIASFSSAHGLLSWLALIPSVVSITHKYTQKRKIISLWVLLFIFSGVIYSIGYQKQGVTTPDIFFFFKKPLSTANYFLSLLGAQFAQGFVIHPTKISPVIGLIILITFLALVVYCVRKEIINDVVPWLSIGLFGILFAIVTTVGRAGFGTEQALISRYTTVPVFIVISIVQIGSFLASSEWRKQVYSFIAGILIIFIFINSMYAVVQAQQIRLDRNDGKVCLHLIHYIEKGTDESEKNCLWPLFPLRGYTRLVRQGAEILNQIGFRQLATNYDFIDNPNKLYGVFDTLNSDRESKSLILRRDDIVKASGWAILPGRVELPQVVMISYNDKKSFITNAQINLYRPDVAKFLNSSRYTKVGWTVEFSAKILPRGETIIKAWVCDSIEKHFVKLFDLNNIPKIVVLED